LNIFLDRVYKEIKGNFFLGSLLGGICVWLFFFITIPVNIVKPLSLETVFFVLFNYLALIIGYYTSKGKISSSIEHSTSGSELMKYLRFIIIIIIISGVIRYFDLFYVRGASFFNSIGENKYNLSKKENFSLILGLLSMFRFLYFVPFVLYRLSNQKKLNLLVLTLALFLIPISEGFLRGSRRLIFEPVFILCITLVIIRFKNFKISWRKILLGIIAVFLLFLSSQYIIKDRISNISKNYQETLISARYNDLIPLKKETKEYILDHKGEALSSFVLFYCHLGQYITHGFFEFDFTRKVNSKPKYGMYNAFIIVKLFNSTGISNYPMEELNNPSKRITYITFFGGLYLDFRWFSLLIMFLFGFLQKKIFILAEKNYAIKPIVVLLLMINFMMPIFNFLRAQVLVTVLIYLFALIIFNFLIKKESKGFNLFK